MSFLDKYSSLVIGIATNIALARILTPYDIGIFSMAAALVGLAGAIRDFGIGSYLVQERELTVSRQRSALGVAIVITWLVGGILAACSGPIASFYESPPVREVVLALSVNFLLIPFTMVVVMVLRREMNFAALFRINLVANISRSISGLSLALLGFGFMAMAWSSVSGTVAIFVMTQIELPKEGRLLPSLRDWRHIVGFGTWSTAGQLLGEAAAAAPNVLIGRLLSAADVGLFSRALGMGTLFRQAILEGLAPVALSAVAARHREGGDVRGLMLEGLTYVTALGWPFFLFVALLAFPVMRILFGDQWDQAVPVARLVCLSAAIGMLDSMSWAVLQGTGSVGKFAAVQVFTVPTQIALMAFALWAGKDIEAVGWAVIAGSAVHVAVSLVFLRRLIGVRPYEVVRAVTKSAVLTVISNAVPVLVVLFMTIDATHIWMPFLIAASGAAVGFLVGIFQLRHPLAHEVQNAFDNGWKMVFG